MSYWEQDFDRIEREREHNQEFAYRDWIGQNDDLEQPFEGETLAQRAAHERRMIRSLSKEAQ